MGSDQERSQRLLTKAKGRTEKVNYPLIYVVAYKFLVAQEESRSNGDGNHDTAK